LKRTPYTPLRLQRAREEGRDGNWAGVGDAWTYVTLIISGVIVWGGVGMLLDAWIDTKPVFTIIGSLLGNFAGIYGAYVRAFRKEGDPHAA
jgi:F0F1-type ATP synthase assembly protein I